MSRRHSYRAAVRSRAAKAAKSVEKAPAPVKKTVRKKAVKKTEQPKADK